MKQILNEWRKFLNEDATFFGEKFVEFKNAADGSSEPLDIAYKLGLKRIGEGSSRVVFELPDNKDFVLKIINTHQTSLISGQDPNKGDNVDVHGFTKQNKKNANMYEADIQIQMENPELFPKSTEYADDYSWILVEKVETLSQEEFRKQLNLPPDIKFRQIHILVEMIIEAKQNIDDKKHYSHAFVAEADTTMSFDDIPSEVDTEIEQNDVYDDGSTLAVPELQAKKTTLKEKVRENIKGILKNTQAVRILMLMAKYDIKSTEFKAANLGISKLNGGKIVLLDTSMWDDKE
jgi:hypothetical protein